MRKLCEQQGIKPAAKQTSADARIAVLEAKLWISSQSEEGNVKKKGVETPKEPPKGETNMNCVYDKTVICASV